MKTVITQKVEKYDPKSQSVVCLGNFDGLHIGHRELIKKGVEKAKDEALSCLVFSFDVHPAVFLKNKSPELLISREEKEKVLSRMGVDYFILGDFFKIKDMTCRDFVFEILIKKLNANLILMIIWS